MKTKTPSNKILRKMIDNYIYELGENINVQDLEDTETIFSIQDVRKALEEQAQKEKIINLIKECPCVEFDNNPNKKWVNEKILIEQLEALNNQSQEPLQATSGLNDGYEDEGSCLPQSVVTQNLDTHNQSSQSDTEVINRDNVPSKDKIEDKAPETSIPDDVKRSEDRGSNSDICENCGKPKELHRDFFISYGSETDRKLCKKFTPKKEGEKK